MQNLAEICYAQKKQTEALALISKVLYLSDAVPSSSHPFTIGRKQILNAWLSKAKDLSLPRNDNEEDETIYELEALNIDGASRTSQEPTESMLNFDATSAVFSNIDSAIFTGRKITKQIVDNKIAR